MMKDQGPKFICDTMLGTLARWLRFLGYDTLYPPVQDDRGLLALARRERRVLLTRDKELAGRGESAFFVSSDRPHRQLSDVVAGFGLNDENAMTRCGVCNGELSDSTREEAKGNVPDGVLERQTEFYYCRSCRKFYWPGTHYQRIARVIERLRSGAPAD